MALDIYAWLAYRLHSLTGPTPLHWKAVKTQFGVGFAQMNGLKPRFLDNLRLALAVYPDARVDVDDRGAGATSLAASCLATPVRGMLIATVFCWKRVERGACPRRSR